MIEAGDRLKGGRWLLDAKLATGGFSVVFAATHRNGSRAAIKILNSEFTEDEDMRRRFLREGYAANKVGHAGVVNILDDDSTEDGRPYLVMELLEGEALDRRRERLGGTLPLAEALQIADELLDVLAAAHVHGIIHRDIKPANVFLTTKGHIKVLDFGFAKVKEAAQAEATAVGTLLGTPGFLPPELARGQKDEVDARSDIWSAAATIFTLITGEHVHADGNPLDLLMASSQRPARSLAEVAPGVPRAIAEVIDKALAFEKESRWSSAGEMREALEEAMLAEEQTKVGAMAMPPPSSLTPSGLLTPVPAPPASDAPLPRLYDDLDEPGNKGYTEVLPASQYLHYQQAAQPAPPPAPIAAPPFAPPAERYVIRPLIHPAMTTTPPNAVRRNMWPLVIGSALAVLGIVLGLFALFSAR